MSKDFFLRTVKLQHHYLITLKLINPIVLLRLKRVSLKFLNSFAFKTLPVLRNTELNKLLRRMTPVEKTQNER